MFCFGFSSPSPFVSKLKFVLSLFKFITGAICEIESIFWGKGFKTRNDINKNVKIQQLVKTNPTSKIRHDRDPLYVLHTSVNRLPTSAYTLHLNDSPDQKGGSNLHTSVSKKNWKIYLQDKIWKQNTAMSGTKLKMAPVLSAPGLLGVKEERKR